MKTKVKVLSLVAVLAMSFAAVAPTFAQGNPPAYGETEVSGEGRGGRGGRIVQMAETLGLTIEEVQALFDSGMTMPEIFEQAGLEMPARPEHTGEGVRGGPIGHGHANG